MSEASIVFRTKDMFSTGKIYLNDMEKAAILASTYRNASYFVDVINQQDEVAYRWENGAPDWKLGEVVPAALQSTPYRFERRDDPTWDPQNRLWALVETVTFAFDTAVRRAGEHDFDAMVLRTEQLGNDDTWNLIAEAKQVAKVAKRLKSATAWGELIDDWMSDTDHLFAAYALEQTALDMYVFAQEPLSIPSDMHGTIHALSVELADLVSQRAKLLN
ncbi:hypothetical protein MWU61_01650 [Loktanella sp. F6476L]|uniref:hypothetical protein n=1 Tax=Loktanella sp. F6476L TaxID=2926405 RepID=UPI001FF6E5FF|nr:hypothetical protein [Loktanella sp. F6476L]MCK0119228.1 hypothetical protein [Loktanella sp. F6476L]